MISSTSTFIESVTRVLGMLNETSVTAFNTPMSIKAQRAVVDSLKCCAQDTNWVFYNTSIPALSWANQLATLPDHIKLKRVRYGMDSTGFVEIPHVFQSVFSRCGLTSYDSTTGGRPSHYVEYDNNRYAFNPYPTDATEQAKIIFDILQTPVLPATAEDTLPFPEQYLMLVEYKAASLLALSHHQSVELSREWNAHYQSALHNIRSNRGRQVLSMQSSGGC